MSRYGADHRALRRALLPAAYGKPCGRCGRVMLPGQLLDLDQDDVTGGYRGMAHARCNRRAGAVKTNRARAEPLRKGRDRGRGVRMPTVTASAVAVEVASDRRHTAVVTASRVEGDARLVVQLAGWLDGSEAGVAEVLRLRCELTPQVLQAVVVDPFSPASTVIPALHEVRVGELVEPAGRDAAVAGGWFVDWYNAKQPWFPDPHPALTAAMREVDLRSLAGAQTLDRRNPVVAPAVAAMWATWGLLNVPKRPQAVVW